VSDPTAPHSDNNHPDGVPSEHSHEPDSEPIDVNELLESTRKLFDPEEIQRAMEQAGYTPDQVETKPQHDSHPESDDEPALDSHETTSDRSPNPPDDVDNDGETVVHSADDGKSPENTALKGVNVLSIAAIFLALALSPLAVVFGYIALGQTRRAGQRGEAMALWAIGLGWVVFAAWAVLIGSLVWIGYQQGITVESLREFIELFSLP